MKPLHISSKMFPRSQRGSHHDVTKVQLRALDVTVHSRPVEAHHEAVKTHGIRGGPSWNRGGPLWSHGGSPLSCEFTLEHWTHPQVMEAHLSRFTPLRWQFSLINCREKVVLRLSAHNSRSSLAEFGSALNSVDLKNCLNEMHMKTRRKKKKPD
jgi:hypothetical protein